MRYDVIIAGAGPGGSSAAAFLARAGFTVALLDQAEFPREKVCGDGILPQALCWLDKLGCIDEVLRHCEMCISGADLFTNGDYSLTGDFPRNTPYPHFGVCLRRKIFDSILVSHAMVRGAVFKPGRRVTGIERVSGGIVVSARTGNSVERFSADLLLGADGAGSVVSRFIGNKEPGTRGLFMRAYFDNVRTERSPFKIFLNERYFPGYGWIYSGIDGCANVGFGYIRGSGFPMSRTVGSLFREFIATDGRPLLGKAAPRGQPAGWWIPFAPPPMMGADRILLVGDAGRCAEPMTGAGIHKAIESSWIAAQIVVEAFTKGSFSSGMAAEYQRRWRQVDGRDRTAGNIFLTLVKNPAMKQLYFRLLGAVVEISKDNRQLRDFCCGILGGTVPQRSMLSPWLLGTALLGNPTGLLTSLRALKGASSGKLVGEIGSMAAGTAVVSGAIIGNPIRNLRWVYDVLRESTAILGNLRYSKTPDPFSAHTPMQIQSTMTTDTSPARRLHD